MPFLETQPGPMLPLQPEDPWMRFRVGPPWQVEQTLGSLAREDTPLVVGLPGGETVPATLWASDAGARRLRLRVTVGDGVAERLARLRAGCDGLPCAELVAAAYRGGAKLQFDLPGAEFLGQGQEWVIQSGWPRQMLRLPRRSAVRVRRRIGDSPIVMFEHPLAPDCTARLRALDISTEGCALWLPAGELPLVPDLLLRQVEVELDEASIFYADLRVVHLRPVAPGEPGTPEDQSGGVSAGCRWEHLPEPAAATLEAWIAGGRRRREMVHLSFGD